MNISEIKFSTSPASNIDKSKLPRSAYLITESDARSTWHLPIQDTDGNVNVSFLRAAKEIAESKTYRDKEITFTISESAQKIIVDLWDAWEKQKAVLQESQIVLNLEEGSVGEYLTADELKSKTYPPAKEVSLSECIRCDMLTEPVEVFEAESINTEKRTARVTVITSGWSKNGRYYTKQAVKRFAEQLQKRPKFFAGHETGALHKKLDRPIAEHVATVIEENGKRQAWYEEGPDGRGRAKADIRFTHYAIGEQTMKEAKANPKDVRLSINGRVFIRKDVKNEGKTGESVEDVKFLFSPDFVSYDAANGGVDFAEAMEGEEDLMEAAGGIYKVLDAVESPEGEGKEVRSTEEAIKSLKERFKDAEIRDKFWRVSHLFQDVVREILVDKDSEYKTMSDKEKAINATFEQWKTILLKFDSDALKEQIENEAQENNNLDRKENDMDKLTLEEAKTNKEVVEAVLKSVDPMKFEVEIGGKKQTIAAAFEAASGENKRLKDQVAESERREANARAFDKSIEEHKLEDKHITESFRNSCLKQTDDKLPENYESMEASEREKYKTASQKIESMVSEHADFVKKLSGDESDTTESDTGNSQAKKDKMKPKDSGGKEVKESWDDQLKSIEARVESGMMF